MSALDTSSPQSPPSRDTSQRFSAVRLPIEEPVDDFERTVEKLRTCSSTDLRRARQHHRRAIESLQEGGYSALSESTRSRLLARLRSNLKALNHALDTRPSASDAPAPSDAHTNNGSFSDRFYTFFQGLW